MSGAVLRIARLLLLSTAVLGGPVLGGMVVESVLDGTRAAAQSPTGEIRGTITNGTAGAGSPVSASVELLELALNGATRTLETTPDAAGRFAFVVAADPGFTYLLRVQYAGVPYLSPPLILNSDLPTIDQPMTVYETTDVPPDLRIATTNVTVLALDRGATALALERTDIVINPVDRVYIGAPSGSAGAGVTFRLPLPDDTVEASGLSEGTAFQIEEGLLLGRTPLLPGENRIVSRYLVGYDPAGDSYRLRITAPLPTERLEILVPTAFADEFRTEGATHDDGTVDVGEARLRLFAVDRVGPGQGGVVTLAGLAGRNAANPLTSRGGALAGIALAGAAIAGGAWGAGRWRDRPAVPTS